MLTSQGKYARELSQFRPLPISKPATRGQNRPVPAPTTPAMVLGVADRVWTIGDLLDAALATQPITPVTTAPDRRKRFTVIEGGRES